MTEEPFSLSSESQGEFGRSFALVLCAHVVLIAAAWVGGRVLLKRAVPEPITWLDGGGELGSASPLAVTESGATTPPPSIPEPAPEVLPPLPAEPAIAPKEPSEMPAVVKVKPLPTPTPQPRPTQTPVPRPKDATPTPRAPDRSATPKRNSSARITPAPAKKTTPVPNAVKVATPKPGKEPERQVKNADSPAKPIGAEPGPGNSTPGSGEGTNPGSKGGPGASGGTAAVTLAYFKKIEAHFRREWKKPLTSERTGREVEAFVRLRAASDGTVESLKLVKPTGNPEVDQSIEQALRRVTKVEPPPAELLKNGHLDEMVEFILEI